MPVCRIECQNELHGIEVDDKGDIHLLNHPNDEEEALHAMGIEEINCYHIANRLSDDPSALLDEAVRLGGDLQLAKLALAAGADVHYKGETILIWAAITGNPDVVRLLIDAGADVNACDGAPLRKAAECGNIVVFSILVDAGANTSVLEAYEPL